MVVVNGHSNDMKLIGINNTQKYEFHFNLNNIGDSEVTP